MRFSAMLRGLDAAEMASAAEGLLRLLDGTKAAAGSAVLGGETASAAATPRGGTEDTAADSELRHGTGAEERRALAETLEAISAERMGARPPICGGADAGANTPFTGAGPGPEERAPAAERALPAAAPETDMDAVSEFFRRDSRRYDSGFGG